MQHKRPSIDALILLGRFLKQFEDGIINPDPYLEHLNRKHYDAFVELTEHEHIHNPWFTPPFVKHALSGISLMLEPEVLEQWLDAYPSLGSHSGPAMKVGLVFAGNIPLVGFHDLLCVLVSGHHALIKPSGKDERLPKRLAELLRELDGGMAEQIVFTDDRLAGIDALIATGSNNTARYFEYYFRKIPHIIRKNRNGVAVLTGEETETELRKLGEDIFTYFGMGCRNVTKLYIPRSYDLKGLLRILDHFSGLYQHHKYGNNVDYYRSIYLLNRIPILDNGVLLLKEDTAIASPVGVVFYERYTDIGWVRNQLSEHQEEIQCCVSVHPGIEGAIPPGTTQEPMPWDYADGVDTLRFLTELN